jgi:hypothetical protein
MERKYGLSSSPDNMVPCVCVYSIFGEEVVMSIEKGVLERVACFISGFGIIMTCMRRDFVIREGNVYVIISTSMVPAEEEGTPKRG